MAAALLIYFAGFGFWLGLMLAACALALGAYHSGRLAKDGAAVIGLVRDTSEDGEKLALTRLVIYRDAWRDNQAVRLLRFLAIPSLKAGEKVQLRYDPNAPWRATLIGRRRQILLWVAALSCFAAAAAFTPARLPGETAQHPTTGQMRLSWYERALSLSHHAEAQRLNAPKPKVREKASAPAAPEAGPDLSNLGRIGRLASWMLLCIAAIASIANVGREIALQRGGVRTRGYTSQEAGLFGARQISFKDALGRDRSFTVWGAKCLPPLGPQEVVLVAYDPKHPKRATICRRFRAEIQTAATGVILFAATLLAPNGDGAAPVSQEGPAPVLRSVVEPPPLD